MSFGLREADLEYITSRLQNFPEIEKALIFGSRAKGTFRPGSDVDIAVFGEAVSFSTISKLKDELEEEGPLPYLFDIVDAIHDASPELRSHIDRMGKLIFSR